MAGKYALYLPYKILSAMEDGALTDKEFREFIMKLAHYAYDGTNPEFSSNVLTMLFTVTKSDIDFSREKYNRIVERNQQNGKKGGAPNGNKNAARKGGDK